MKKRGGQSREYGAVIKNLKATQASHISSIHEVGCQSKVLFNKCLNNYYTLGTALKFFTDIVVYADDQAKEMAKLSANGKSGEMFNKMIEIEDNLMNSLQLYLPVDSLRLHDALIIPSGR